MAVTRANSDSDTLYDGLRAGFGAGSPKSSGYRSGYAFRRERALVLEAVGDASGRIVDLACGAGLVSMPLVNSGRPVVGIDYNAAACREARRNGLAALRGDVFGLPLAAGSADLMLNVEFAQQYEPEAIQDLLREASRVLRRGGRLVIVWRNGRSLAHRVAHGLFSGVDRLQGRPSLALVDHAPAEMRAAAGNAGLALDRLYAIFPPLGLRLRRADGLLAGLVGSSFVATFRK